VPTTDPDFVYIRIPSIDALQEFKMVSGIYPAQFGREAAQFTSRPSPGPMTFEFLRNSNLGAKPFDFLAASPAKAPL
jgi:hypothetical protein